MRAKVKLIALIDEAQLMEVAHGSALRARIDSAKPSRYRAILQLHLRATERHTERVHERLRELGHRRSLLRTSAGIAKAIADGGRRLGSAPARLVLSGDRHDRMLRSARDQMAEEAAEIAAYDAIARMGNDIGDERTAAMALDIRTDAEEMLETLRGEILDLADAVIIGPSVNVRTDDDARPVILEDDLARA